MLCLWGTVNSELCFVYLLRIKEQKHVNVVLRRGFAATDFKVNWPSKFSILWYSSTSYWETNVTARPARPARAVLPTLYTNSKNKTKAKIYLALYSIIMSHLSRALKMFLNKKCTVQNVSVRNVRCARFFFFFGGGYKLGSIWKSWNFLFLLNFKRFSSSALFRHFQKFLWTKLRYGYKPCYVSECRSLWQYIHVRDIYWFTCVSNPCYVSEYRSLWQYIRVREIYRYTWGMDIILAMFRNVVVYDNISMWEIYTGLPVNIILAMWEYRSLWQ